MRLYAARHGETVENKQKRILGQTPGVLTPEGQAQGRRLATQVSELAINLVLASDLQRAKDTCAFLDDNLVVGFTPRLRERDFGSWEGLLRKEVNWQGIWESIEEPRLSAESGVEPLDDFTQRIARFVISLTDSFDDTETSVLLVSHIGVMNRLNFLSNPDSFSYIDYPNAEAIEFDTQVLARNSHKFV